MIRIAHLHKTTLDATIGTLFLFAIGVLIRTITHTLLFKMGGIGGNARNSQARYSRSLEGFQLGLRLRDGFLSGSPKHQGRVGRDISRARSDGKRELKMERMLSTPQVVSSNRQKFPPRHNAFQAWVREEVTLANTGWALEVEGNC